MHTHRSSLRHLLKLLILVGLLSGCSPAALETEEAHRTADALYTAITSKRTDLLDAVESDLKKLSNEQKLSDDALEKLRSFIGLARENAWQEAAENLDSFIRHQPHREHTH